MLDENKTKKQLLDELTVLRQRVTDLERTEAERQRFEFALGKRGKKLRCFNGICRIIESPGISLDELYQEVVNILPTGWQYPSVTCSQITINEKRFEL